MRQVLGWGSLNSRYILLGECPADREIETGEPFSGASGWRLKEWWAKAGLRREDFYIDNVCQYQAQHNSIETFDAEYLKQWMSHLHQRLVHLTDPYVIVCAGNYSLYALTGKGKVKWHQKDGQATRAGITEWRGSILSYTMLDGRVVKVVPTIHPAATFRQADYEGICIRDWQKIAYEGTFKDLNLPVRQHDISPTEKDVETYLGSFHSGDVVAVDIENPREHTLEELVNEDTGRVKKVKVPQPARIVCLAFSHDPLYSLTVPTTREYWGDDATLERIWRMVSGALSSGLTHKVFHNGLYDAFHLQWEKNIRVRNYEHDTLYMHHCFTQDTRILQSDCTYKKIMDVRVGDELLGFDEYPTNGRYKRHLKTSKVTKVHCIRRQYIYKVVLDNGEHLRATADHKILVGDFDRGGGRLRRAGNVWKTVSELQTGDELYSVGRPWDSQHTPDTDWMAGVYDGEGSIGVRKWGSDGNDRSAHISFSQKPGLVLDKTKRILTNLNFSFNESSSPKAHNINLRGGLAETLRFLGTFPSVRLLNNFHKIARTSGWNGFTGLRGVKVVRVVPDGKEIVYDLSTTTRTFIANGIVVHNCCDPSDKHGLAYCASHDTREPYWKGDFKDPDEIAKDFYNSRDTFYRYNGKDAAVTRELYDVYTKRLRESGRLEFYLEHYGRLLRPLEDLQLHGVKVADDKRRYRLAHLTADCVEIQDVLEVRTGIKLYGKSSLSNTKLKTYLYDTLKLPPQERKRKERGEKTTSADELAVRTLMLKHPTSPLGRLVDPDPPVAQMGIGQLILTHKYKGKQCEFYAERRIDPDGYFRSSYSMNTEAGRLSSYKNPNGTGSNAQNQSRETRDMFLADPDMVGIEVDLSAVESRIDYALVFMLTGNKAMYDRARLRPDEYDQHKESASFIFNTPTDDVTESMRYLGKKTNHGMWRDQQGIKLAEELLKDGIVRTGSECQRMIDNLRKRTEGIDELFRWMRRQALEKRYVENTWGRRLLFTHDRFNDELYRRVYSFFPQSECADHMNQLGLLKFFWYIDDLSKREGTAVGHINVHAHDALFFSALPQYAWELTNFLVTSLEQTRQLYGVTLSIPCELKMGLTWQGTQKFKRLPTRAVFEEAVHGLA